MIYGDGQKIWITINGVLFIVNAATTPDEGLEWEKRRGIVKQWIYFNRDNNKYHIDTNQVIGPYDPLKPVKHLNNKIFNL